MVFTYTCYHGYLKDASSDFLRCIFKIFSVNREDLITRQQASVSLGNAAFDNIRNEYSSVIPVE